MGLGVSLGEVTGPRQGTQTWAGGTWLEQGANS